jgi:uncharacterized protein YciI
VTTAITDAYMRDMLSKTRSYVVVILRGTDKLNEPGAQAIVWEHGRRNFQLRAEGRLAIVCPIRDGSGVNGVGIFNTTLEEAKSIMDGDPGVQAGLFTYDLHACRSFPGDALPEQ